MWGSLLLASSVSLGIWAAGFSAQFVNDEIQQAASATPRKQGKMRGPLPQAVSGKGWAPLKHGGLGAWRMRCGGCGKTDLRFPGLCLRPGFSHQLAPGAKHFTPLSLCPDSHNGYFGYFRSARSMESSRGLDKMCEALAHRLPVTAHSISTSCQHRDHCHCSECLPSPDGTWHRSLGLGGGSVCVCPLSY